MGIVAAVPMHAVLNLSCLSGPTEGAAAPIPMENVYIADLSISAAGHANFSIFAPGIARSRFLRLQIDGVAEVTRFHICHDFGKSTLAQYSRGHLVGLGPNCFR